MSEYTFNLNEDSDTGRFYANVYEPATQWRTRLSLLTTDKSVARDRLTMWERMAARGDWDPRSGRPQKGQHVSLEQAAERFLEDYREEVRQVTAKNMRSALKMLKESLGLETPLALIRAEDVASFIENLTAHGKGAPPGSAAQSTKHQKYNYLSRFFGWCASEGLLERDPIESVDRPQVDRWDTYEVLSPAEATRLLRAMLIEEMPSYARHMTELALASGLRLGELMHLRWEHVDTEVLQGIDPAAPEEADVCSIDVEPTRSHREDLDTWRPKNRHSIRSVMVYPRGAAVLATRWAGRDSHHQWVFCAQNPDGRRDAGVVPPRGRMQELIRRAGRISRLRPDKTPTMHDCRHTWCTWLLNDLGLARKASAIQKMAGHGEIERTWSYVTVSQKSAEDAIYESLGLQSPSGREEDVRAFLCGAPIGQVRQEPREAETADFRG